MNGNLQSTLIVISGVYLLLIAGVYLVDRGLRRDGFSVLKLCAYFALIEASVMMWFALRIERLHTLVLAEVTAKYVQDQYIAQAYAISVFTFVAVAVGAALGSVPRHRIFLVLERKLVRTGAIAERGSKFKALVVFAAGVVLHFWVIQMSGGYAHIWSNFHAGEIVTEGFGWHKAAYSFLITFGMCLAYPYLCRDRNFVRLVAMILVGVFCLGALSQRAPVGIAMFAVLLTHHYAVRPLRGMLNFRVVALAAVLLVFMYAAVQVRHGNIRIENGALILEPRLEELEEHIIMRLGVTERQVTAIGYMDQNPYWGFGIYWSLLTAYQRRAMHPDKPPVDTGVYIKALSEGRSLTPPLPANDMPESSWPDRYLAGYLSVGLVGLVVVAVLSGLFFGLMYRLVVARQGAPAAVYLYGVIGFLGATPLSPLGIVKVGLALVPTAMLGWLFTFIPKFRRARQIDVESGKNA